MEWNVLEGDACQHAFRPAYSTHLSPGLVENFHMYGAELCAAAAPAEPRLLDSLVHVDACSIADLVPAEE